MLAANCYLVACPTTRQAAVVDPGAEPERILARITALGLTVTTILHTHGHFDHISATEAVLAGLPTPVPVVVAAHPADRSLYEAAARTMGVPFGYPLPDQLAVPTGPLEDGAEVAIGDLRLRVLHTPGHTPGGVCFHCGGWWVLAGDTLFRRGIGRTDLPGGDEDALYESIATRLYTLPDALTVHAGHGEATTIGEERRGNPFVRG
ncbi:MAG: MBL fold metallo-hydrolase [Ktedonobacterales bacterium]|nr:MBL fold metallo-hydrolase [Ktedonobacterales bacterium]